VILPFDHAPCLWLFCSLHHEVGHNLDQDLRLQGELKKLLAARLKQEQVPEDQRKLWARWAGEILADAFGVLLGGAGFAQGLASLLLVAAPPLHTLDDQDEHPPPYVRVALLVALLRRCNRPALKASADQILQDWQAHDRPAWVAAYAAVSDAVAEVYLGQPLKTLGDHSLFELAPDPDSDADRQTQLVKFLRTGLLRPDPKLPHPFPCRLVPVAAQLAFVELDKPDLPALAALQDRSLKYLQAIPRPQWLAAVDRRAFLRQLVRELDFSTLSADSPEENP
jgi:hypothetical protein